MTRTARHIAPLVALTFLGSAATAAPTVAPPINPSHTPRAPEPKPAAPAKPMSAWRKAYVAKHGHQPPATAAKAAPKPTHPAPKAIAAKTEKKKPAAKLPPVKRCT